MGIFRNAEENRLRAGWRIAGLIALTVLLAVVAQGSVRAVRGGLPRGSDLVIFLIAGSATLAVVVARRFLDKKSFVSLGLRFDGLAVKDLLFGFVLSGLMAGLVFGVMATAGWIEVTGVTDGMTILGLLLLLIPNVAVGWWEELFFRGSLLQNMIEGMGTTVAVLVSCVLYGLVHAMNPSAGILSTCIIVLFGFLRVYGYLATQLLWLSMGMHIGWNYFQGPIFGYAASGHETGSLVAQRPAGPDWLSGGEFGPEASVVIIPVLVLALLAMRGWARVTRRKNGS